MPRRAPDARPVRAGLRPELPAPARRDVVLRLLPLVPARRTDELELAVARLSPAAAGADAPRQADHSSGADERHIDEHVRPVRVERWRHRGGKQTVAREREEDVDHERHCDGGHGGRVINSTAA